MLNHTLSQAPGHQDFPVQSLWIGEVGMLERLSMASFLANGHPYHLYVYDEPGRVPPGVELRDASAILPREAIFHYTRGKEKGGVSGFADWFRYRLLAEKGGWWCDTDMICLRPFDIAAPVIATERTRWRTRKLCIAAMHFSPGHPLMVKAAEHAQKNDPTALRFAGNGEPLLRPLVDALGLRAALRPPEDFNPIDWWRSARIIAPGSAALLPSFRYGLHCFGESWRWRLRDREASGLRDHIFPSTTLLGALQQRYLPQEVSDAA